jgi:HEAT repeat protein
VVRPAPLLLLCAALGAPAPLARAERTEALARASAAERAGDRSALQRFLSDPDRGVRRRAALGAGRLSDPGLTPSLVPLLSDVEPAVRAAAAWALGRAGAPAGQSALLAALADPAVEVRARAAEALGRLEPGSTSAALAAHLENILPPGPRVTLRDDPGTADPWLEPRLALLALADQRDAAAVARVLLPASGPRIDWWPAAWVAARFAEPGLRPVLEASAVSSSPESRAFAAEGLGGHKGSLATLRKLLAEPEPAVVTAALRGLAGQGTREAAQAAAVMVRADRPGHRAEALRALAAGPPIPELAVRVLPALADPDPAARAAAHLALAHLDPDQYPLLLSSLDADPDRRVRAATAQAILRIGGPLAEARLPEFAADPEPEVRAAARAAAADPAAQRSERPRPLADHLAATAPYQAGLAGQIYSPRLILDTTAGRIEILLDPVAAPLAVADLAARVRSGAWIGREIAGVDADRRVLLEAQGPPLPAEPAPGTVGRGHLFASHEGLSIALSPRPELARDATVLGSVSVGLAVAERLRPADRVLAAAVWDGR